MAASFPQTTTNRRCFLMASAMASLAITSGCARSTRASHSRQGQAFGTTVKLTASHSNVELAQQALDEAFDELMLVESLMSIYDPQSQLSQLNEQKVLENPHPYLVEILRHATLTSQQSNGAFDVTIQPLWDVWQQAQTAHTSVCPTELAAARRKVGWRKLYITESRISIGPESKVTLNGIAQGYAADKAAAALLRYGIKRALLDTGEINATSDEDTNKDTVEHAAWKVGIQHPRIDSAFVAVAALGDRCLATSGDYETTFSADYKHNHLLNPRTGTSPDETASVSVVAPTATQADALSTAAFVLGPAKGGELIQRTAGADALFVLKNGRVLKTDGFPLCQQEANS